MVSIQATIVGAAQVEAKFSTLTEEVRKELRTAVAIVGAAIQRSVVQNYLHGPRPTHLGVKSGRLTRSINMKPFESANEIGTSVGTNVEYARRWELGFKGVEHVSGFVRSQKSQNVRASVKKATGKASGVAFVKAHERHINQEARPFLKPALQDNQQFAQDTLQAAIVKAVAKK